MALSSYCLAASHCCFFSRLLVLPQNQPVRIASNYHSQVSKMVSCMSHTLTNLGDIQKVERRSANYKPSIWKYELLQSFESKYAGNSFVEQIEKLKEDVNQMLQKIENPLGTLEVIDDLQRLGVSYHFEDEIKKILEGLYNNKEDMWIQEDSLYATSLKFRLLRQHGYNCLPDVFDQFKDEIGNLKACISEDTKGLLSLYEASYLLVQGESILEEARDFSAKHLKEILKKDNLSPDLAILVSHALELPLHWRVSRLEARWFIDVYERRSYMNPTILALAKLDFNMVQAIHQEDLKYVTRWWRSGRLVENLSFARDRLVECFLWAMGMKFDPRFGYCRRMSTKVNALITLLDDIYDVYGTLEELELFTNAVERWDISTLEQLPDYMKICFHSLFNTINEMAYDTLIGEGLLVIPYLKRTWSDLCKSFLLEAKWYHTEHKPTLEEYLNNAWISVSGEVILGHALISGFKPITKDGLDLLEKHPNIIRLSSMVFRLANDLGTSSDEMERGDTPTSIQCYMHETGTSEEAARQHIKNLIGESWKKLNEERVVAGSPFSQAFIEAAMNLCRISQCTYQYGDGHAGQGPETINRVLSLVVNPIPL